jgi:hypothetical protein
VEINFATRRNRCISLFGSSFQRGEGRMEDLVGNQFWRQQPLENQALGQGVYDAHELVCRHGEIFLFRDGAKPLLAERITLGRNAATFARNSSCVSV